MNEIVLNGVSAAPGIASGYAFILDKQDFIVSVRAIMEKEIPIEIARFEEALIRTREEILAIQKKMNEDIEGWHAKIFDAHLLVLEDRLLLKLPRHLGLETHLLVLWKDASREHSDWEFYPRLASWFHRCIRQ